MDSGDKKEFAHVAEILTEIRENTASPWWRMVLNGMLYGAGAVTGTVLAIFLLGYVLSLFGVIPGFEDMAARLQNIVNSKM